MRREGGPGIKREGRGDDRKKKDTSKFMYQ